MQGDDEVQKLCLAAYTEFFKQNALLAGAYLRSVSYMEQEVQETAQSLLGGGPRSGSNLTSGGSESIYCALHAARQWARSAKPEIAEPEFVVPWSIHPAFSKGADILGIKLVRTMLGDDHRASIAAIRAAITPNTIGLAGSAPCWPYGLFDDIPGLAALALEHNLWMHTDACVGGFIAPFVAKTGRPIPPFDLSVPGVRSLSADLHKYGYSAKPNSVILWADASDQQYHYQIIVSSPTGPYVSQGFAGSRPAGAVASAWAVMRFLGEEGYVRLAEKTMSAKEYVEDAMRGMGFDVWKTDVALLVAGHPKHDVRKIVAGMKDRGWAMMGTPFPPLIHMTFDAVEREACDPFCSDLRDVVLAVEEGRIAETGALSYV
ncbi:aspartate aminotransferase family protein [Salmonella enterica subsp. enterica]|nr:aspartate aminotransferase family protein [Salmonella enterica subsp. enterica]